MRIIGTLTAVALLVVACGGSNTPATTAAPAASGYPAAGAYPAATAYPQPGAATAYPTAAPATGYPTAAPTAATPTGAPAMATPNAMALPCSNDQACGLAHCNTAAGKCAFPCANSAVDCIQGASCNAMTGFCLPGG